MKNTFLLIGIFFIQNISFSQTIGWYKQNSGTNNTLYSVYCINADTVIAVGENGTIVRTIDGGVQWDSVYSGTTNTLRSVKFVNKNIGYAVGSLGTILKSTNSGVNWFNIGITTNMTLLDIHFISSDTCWIVGGNEQSIMFPIGNKGLILKTINGGTIWIVDSTFNKVLPSVFFVNKDTGYITGNNDTASILETTNGGNDWNYIYIDTVTSYNFYFSTIYFSNAKTGYLIGKYGLYKTNDYGNTWNEINNQHSIRSFYVIDSCLLYWSWIDMGACQIFKQDVCLSQINGELYGNFWDLDFVNKDTGYAVGYNYQGGIIYKRGFIENIQKIETKRFSIYPNPFKDKTIITFNSKIINNNDLNVSIFNSLGKNIMDIEKVKLINDYQFKIDLSNYKPGLYYLVIKDEQKIIQIDKLIKL